MIKSVRFINLGYICAVFILLGFKFNFKKILVASQSTTCSDPI
jgi:hypothetical protein